MARQIENLDAKLEVVAEILTRANSTSIKIDEKLYQELGTEIWSSKAVFCADVAKYATRAEYIVDRAKKAGTVISRSAATPEIIDNLMLTTNPTINTKKTTIKSRKDTNRALLDSNDMFSLLASYIMRTNEPVNVTDLIEICNYDAFYSTGYNFVACFKKWCESNNMPIYWQAAQRGGSIAANDYHMFINKTDSVESKKEGHINEIKSARRTAVWMALKAIIMASDTQVSINDFIDEINEVNGIPVFSSALYYGTCMREYMLADNDVQFKSQAPFGTIAAKKGIDINLPYKAKTKNKKVGRKKNTRFAEMFLRIGQAPIKFRGEPITLIIDQKNWKKCKAVPKTFARPEVIEVWRKNIENGQTEYLTIDKTGQQYMFVQM